jgi:hypothetical protein
MEIDIDFSIRYSIFSSILGISFGSICLHCVRTFDDVGPFDTWLASSMYERIHDHVWRRNSNTARSDSASLSLACTHQ